jgi:hypothetical protein
MWFRDMRCYISHATQTCCLQVEEDLGFFNEEF